MSSARSARKRRRVSVTKEAAVQTIVAETSEQPTLPNVESAPPKPVASPRSRPASSTTTKDYRGIIVGIALAAIVLLVLFLATGGLSGTTAANQAAQKPTAAAADAAFAGIDRTSVQALMSRGKDLYDQSKFEDAARVYQEVIRLKPDNQAAQSNLGSTYFRLQKIPEALAAFREAVRLNPNDAEARQNLGAGLAAQGSFDDAITQYQQAVTLKPDLAPAHYSLGVLYQQKGSNDLAIQELKRYLEIGTDSQLRADVQSRLQTLGAK